VNHSFSAEEKRKLNVYESIDYFAPNSAVYRRWLARQVRCTSCRHAVPICTMLYTSSANVRACVQSSTCLASHVYISLSCQTVVYV
jgi:hypothetical protein